MPKEYIPNSIFLIKNQKLAKTLSDIKNKNIEFPLIIKPNIGFRGLLVKKINSKEELQNYLKKYNFTLN